MIQLERTTAAEGAARATLRRQIARLELELSDTLVSGFPRIVLERPRVAATVAAAPRLLGLGELELVRDELVARVGRIHDRMAARREFEAANRDLLERMLLDPARHRRVRIANADVGGGGCGIWHVKPRLGLVGMLAGWWEVKLSSGCPLGDGPALSQA